MGIDILLTGGAGFIGANFVHEALHRGLAVAVLDCFTYAGNRLNLAAAEAHPGFSLVVADICDEEAVSAALSRLQPRFVAHFAAESHVDRSIVGPGEFVRTNVHGTYTLLEAVLAFWRRLDPAGKAAMRFLHVSTDEVYGSLGPQDPPFCETTPYAPNSPYAATKAASDHLVRAYHHTYGLPTLTTNCSNNYGPFQFPEKLIPLMLLNALEGKPLPVYGDGQNVRDWLHVTDHCSALLRVLEAGRPGETYNIGGGNEVMNIEVVRQVCALLDELRPRAHGSHADLMTFVADRPGHDRRYAIDSRRIKHELGWQPAESFASGLRKTVTWYLDNAAWVDSVRTGAYRAWCDANYGSRAAASQAAA